MADVIDRDELLIALDKLILDAETEGRCHPYADGLRDAMKLAERMPSVRIADPQTACGRDGGPGAAAT